VLRSIFGPKRNEVAGVWRRLHNEELMIFTLTKNNSVTKSRRVRWVGHVGRVGKRICIQGFGAETMGKDTTWKTEA